MVLQLQFLVVASPSPQSSPRNTPIIPPAVSESDITTPILGVILSSYFYPASMTRILFSGRPEEGWLAKIQPVLVVR